MEEDEERGLGLSLENEVPLEADKYQDWGFNDGSKADTYSSDGAASEGDSNAVMEQSPPFFPGADLSPFEGFEGVNMQGLPEGFSLIEFVKQELRRENQAELSRYKEEIREQVLGALREEAGAILHSFSSNVLQTVKGPSRARSYIPVDPLARARSLRDVERRGAGRMRMETRVADGIVEGMKAALGSDQVDSLLEDTTRIGRQPSSSERPQTVGGGGGARGQQARGRVRPRPTSMSNGSGQEELERIDRYISKSPLYPDYRVAAQRQSKPRRHKAEAPPPIDSARLAEYRGEEEEDEAEEGTVGKHNSLDERTCRLLGATEKLLGDVQQQQPQQQQKRAQTSMGGSRRKTTRQSREGESRRPRSSLTGNNMARPGPSTGGGRPTTSSRGATRTTRGSPNFQETSLPFEANSDLLILHSHNDENMPDHPASPSPAQQPSTRVGPPKVVGDKIKPSLSSSGADRPRPKTSSLSGRPGSSVPQIRQLRKAKLLADNMELKEEGEEHLPVKLGDEEWENEVARNVLTLYVSSMKQREEEIAAEAASAAAAAEAEVASLTEHSTTKIFDDDHVVEDSTRRKQQARRPQTTMTGMPRQQRHHNVAASPSRNMKNQQQAPASVDEQPSYQLGQDMASMMVTSSSSTIDSITQSLSFAIEKGKPVPKSKHRHRYGTPDSEGHGIGEDDLPRRPGTTPKMIHSVGHSRIVVDRRGGGSGLVLIPRTPKTIWFGGSGTNKAEWSSLPGITLQVIQNLRRLNDKGSFTEYVEIIETLLLAAPATPTAKVVIAVPEHNEEEDQAYRHLLAMLWRQFIVTVNSFAARCIEVRRYASALKLLNKALSLLELASPGKDARIAVLERSSVLDLSAFISDTYAHYYHVRGKQHAALSYLEKAMRIHARRKNWRHVAIGHLHSSAILGKLGKASDGLKSMTQVLHMVESGQLEFGGGNGSTQMIALVSVCYHNMAVLNVMKRNLGEAFMCSQNGRRLARLSLNYTNRWTETMEKTHKMVVCELVCKYKYIQKVFQNKGQEALFEALLNAMGSS